MDCSAPQPEYKISSTGQGISQTDQNSLQDNAAEPSYNLYKKLTVHVEPNIVMPNVRLEKWRFMFLDTLVADLKSIIGISPHAPYDYVEYMTDGEKYVVRTDAEADEIASIRGEQPVHIWLRSSRLLPNTLLCADEDPPFPNVVNSVELATGNFGVVYRGYDDMNQRVVAIKKINHQFRNSDRAVVSEEVGIFRLARACPFIVHFYNAYQTHDSLTLYLEYMDGFSLDKYGILPLEVHGSVSVSVINGLTFLWNNRIMHRDIKPSNFLVNTNGHVKITDFGTSRIVKMSVVRSEVGTRAYLSPEQVSGETYSFPSEVWSLGISLAEMALGTEVLFPRKMEQGRWTNVPRHVEQEFREIQKVLNEYDNALFLLVNMCLIQNPESRIESYKIKNEAYYKMHEVRLDVMEKFVKQKVSQIEAQLGLY